MTFDDIKEIQKKVVILQNCSEDANESNTRSKLVVPFLQKLGFEENWFFYENPVVKGKAIPDITVKVNGKVILFVEVKKVSTNKIESKDLHQIISYLNSKNIEWGILTNGKEYVLVNNEIKGEYFDTEVIRYNIFGLYDSSILSCFSYKNLFVNKLSYYKKYLKQYKIFRLKQKNNYHSWSRYNETIEKYFIYLEYKFGFREIKYLSEDDFVNFIKSSILTSKNNKSSKSINSIKTIVNKYSHIRNFYDLFLKNNLNNLVNENPFKIIYSDLELSEIYDLSYNLEPEPLSNEEIEYILEGYEATREPERNRIMFLLCLYCGVKREDLANLKISDIDFENRTIKFNDMIFVFPIEFIKKIEIYINEYRNKEFNSDYFFARKYEGYSEEPIENSSINDMIKKASGFLKTKSRNIQINPEKIKEC